MSNMMSDNIRLKLISTAQLTKNFLLYSFYVISCVYVSYVNKKYNQTPSTRTLRGSDKASVLSGLRFFSPGPSNLSVILRCPY